MSEKEKRIGVAEENILKLVTNTVSTNFNILKPIGIYWKPQEDITAHELALCLPILINAYNRPVMPSEVDREKDYMRHFKIIDPN